LGRQVYGKVFLKRWLGVIRGAGRDEVGEMGGGKKERVSFIELTTIWEPLVSRVCLPKAQ